ncbi:MAG: response regulator [Xenococcaceae cyanobacterium MO_188.B32]|nr:response regulator [Xenococcaceae cyanobacterium MO_188.B32]
MKSNSILIVEGELIVAESLALDLQQAGYNIAGIVDSGMKAIQKIAETIPDLILIDIALSGEIDGIATCEKIQAEYDIPIIYLTSLCDRATLKRARNTRPKGYIIKPYKLEDVKATIASVLQTQDPSKISLQKLPFNLPSSSSRDRQLKREQHRQFLPKLSREDAKIVAKLQQEGVYLTSLAEFKLPHTKRFIKEMKILHPHLYTLSTLKNWRVGIPSLRKFFYTEILFWGLGERLLNIVENYIGLPVILNGVDLRRDIADAPITDARQWHLDIDDDRMIKVIVYLNNVGKTGGPYEYIPPLWTDKIIKALSYTSGFVSDEAIAKIAPPTEWKTCAAKAGTIIITDPHSVFHRAKPAKRNRYSITFGYTSQFPQVSLSEFKLSPAEWQRVNPSLSKRQLACLPNHPKFEAEVIKELKNR